MNDLICLALVTELLDFFGCHLMAVDGSPYGKLTFDILVAVVGTVIGSWPDSYLTATLWTLADGGIQIEKRLATIQSYKPFLPDFIVLLLSRLLVSD